MEPIDPYRIYLEHPQPVAATEGAVQVPKTLKEYYGEQSDRVAAELEELFKPFRTEILLGQRHYAPCPTWRDELLTIRQDDVSSSRFVVRVHVFEKYPNDSPGRYLGFVSLRPPEPRRSEAGIDGEPRDHRGFAYVVEAELTTPSHMKRPRYHVVTTMAASVRLGVMPLRSAVYSSAGLHQARGSTCTHLAVSQALHLVMGRFGCRPISQIEFDWLLWKEANRPGVSVEELASMGTAGVRLESALNVIRESCRGGGFLVSIRPGGGRTELSESECVLAHRWITDILASGLPIIALVNTQRIVPSSECMSHTILVIGMHLLHGRAEVSETEDKRIGKDAREDCAELPGRLVYHDSLARGPYVECSFNEFLEATTTAYETASGRDSQDGESADDSRQLRDAYVRKQRETTKGVHFLVVGPPRMHMGLHAAHQAAEILLGEVLATLRPGKADVADAVTQGLRNYLSWFGLQPDDYETGGWANPSDWRLVSRLVTPDEVTRVYGRGLPENRDSTLRNDTSRYWAVEAHHPMARPMSGDEHRAPRYEFRVFLWDCSLDVRLEGVFPPPTIEYRWASGELIPSC